MNHDVWQKIMSVVKKTGDRVIVVDENDELFVVIDFEQYQGLVEKNLDGEDLTDEELLDKINRDIDFPQSLDAVDAVNIEKEEAEDDYYIEPV
jgi:PHD/YefM family antitoxin component YafN of YafNO toxin-antitoxin module